MTEVHTPGPTGIVVYRNHKQRLMEPSDGFTELFGRTNAEQLSSKARQAMVEFVRRGHGKRPLRLRDRDGAGSDITPTGILDNAGMILSTLVPVESNANAVRTVFDELTELAVTLETELTGGRI
jgi:hypothetical protein